MFEYQKISLQYWQVLYMYIYIYIYLLYIKFISDNYLIAEILHAILNIFIPSFYLFCLSQV